MILRKDMMAGGLPANCFFIYEGCIFKVPKLRGKRWTCGSLVSIDGQRVEYFNPHRNIDQIIIEEEDKANYHGFTKKELLGK